MKDFTEAPRSMSHVSGTSVTGIVTPSKHEKDSRLKLCACGIETTTQICSLCKIEMEAGISLRVGKT